MAFAGGGLVLAIGLGWRRLRLDRLLAINVRADGLAMEC
jgi:hypothetical protein